MVREVDGIPQRPAAVGVKLVLDTAQPLLDAADALHDARPSQHPRALLLAGPVVHELVDPAAEVEQPPQDPPDPESIASFEAALKAVMTATSALPADGTLGREEHEERLMPVVMLRDTIHSVAAEARHEFG
ncbi:hypothetical protein ACIGW7_19675 [Streptomyces sp. NPDC053253]|uniref:hypothetical protein n=1 Tax=Streptomyces sp. NPDC053253 TaxID=3365699 RepID=UPI0037CF29A6